MGILRDLLGLGSGSGDYAERQYQNEQKRQTNITNAQNKINTIFTQSKPKREAGYNQQAGAYFDQGQKLLDRQQALTGKQTTYNLADSGLLGSTAEQFQRGLNRAGYSSGINSLSREAETFRQGLIDRDEQKQAGLLNQVLDAYNPTHAIQQATTYNQQSLQQRVEPPGGSILAGLLQGASANIVGGAKRDARGDLARDFETLKGGVNPTIDQILRRAY